MYDKSFNTFAVLCLAMLVLLSFEAIVFYLRRHFVVALSERIDGKLNRFVFEQILYLPIDFFERTAVGAVTQPVGYINRVRAFLEGQLLGTVLDATAAVFFFLPVMFYLNYVATFVALGVCGIAILWLTQTWPKLRIRSKLVNLAEQERGSFLIQTILGMRTVKSMALEARQRYEWDVHCARVAKARNAQKSFGNIIATVVRPLDNLAVSGALALAVFMAMLNTASGNIDQASKLYIFLLLTRHSVSPLLKISQCVDEWDEARSRIDDIAEIVKSAGGART